LITIIMPFYKKLKEFIFSFEHHNLKEFNQYPNLELIISVDDPFESDELITYLKSKTRLSKVKFAIKVFVNEKAHTWRCPSSAINVGIKQARYEKIIVMSPETVALPQSIAKLLRNCHSTQFAFGIIKHMKQENLAFIYDLEEFFDQAKIRLLPYGSICFTKEQAARVGGYDESFTEWGGDDDDFRERLSKAGYQKIPTFAKFLHLIFNNRNANRSSEKEQLSTKQGVLRKMRQIITKDHFLANLGNYGNEFGKVFFDYHPISHTMLQACEA